MGAREIPHIRERYVFADPAGRDANGMRTAASAVDALKSGGV